jgi:glucose/arabinose dehydrogenase
MKRGDSNPTSGAWTVAAVLSALVFVSGCGEMATLPDSAGVGPAPTLPPPKHTAIPTIEIAPAVGWSDGETPEPAAGLRVTKFAGELDHPRSLHVLPNGDVLVAETNRPAPEPGGGIKTWFMKRAMRKAGAAVPSPDRITLLRDEDGDGIAEKRTTFLSNLNSPFGMALVGNELYVANTDAVVRFHYEPGQTEIHDAGQLLARLPAGAINHHWTKDLIASRDGRRLYATVGSNSNAAERGMEVEQRRAAILEIDRATGDTRIFASGLRNASGLAWEPQSGKLWTAVNERDELGSDLVPDYITAVEKGAFYGWPYSYFGQHVDERVKPQRPDLVARARQPDYAVGTHTASLGLAFSDGARLLPRYPKGAFVGQHGSWNRNPPLGYRVVFVPFADGRAVGPLQEVLTGFLDARGQARGRPVGVAIDRSGALLVADDVGNAVWRVTGRDADITLHASRLAHSSPPRAASRHPSCPPR